MISLVLTGGGTAGHVTPNLALADEAQARGWKVQYVGSSKGIERDLLEGTGIAYHAVASGKLRRYLSWENFIDPFRLLLGVCQSFLLLGRLQPDLVFSKGGFVAVPVVVAAWLRRIPVISHESDVTPGLANRLCYPFSRRICVTFEETLTYLPAAKVQLSGTPVRTGILEGDPGRGRDYLGFDDTKPIMLVFGGSLGAVAINEAVSCVLSNLLDRFQVVHVVGEGNIDEAQQGAGYLQKAFIGAEFGDVLAAASIVVSRAGANSLYELFVSRKPHLLIPLTLAASRGDQLENARTFEARGFSHVLYEEDLNGESFLRAVFELQEQADTLMERLATFPATNSVELILAEIEQNIA